MIKETILTTHQRILDEDPLYTEGWEDGYRAGKNDGWEKGFDDGFNSQKDWKPSEQELYLKNSELEKIALRLEQENEAICQQLAAWERTVPSKEQEVEKYINEFIQQRAQIASSREATPPTQ